MDPNMFPTKGNLILAKNTLRLSNQGYDLMDKKRNILIKEIMELNKQASELQANIERVFSEAYLALQHADISMGIANVEKLSYGIPKEDKIEIKTRSIMGVEIPIVTSNNSNESVPFFGLGNSSSAFDRCLKKFEKVKEMIIELAMIENAAYRLAVTIRKTQKRANALKNVTIPRYKALTKQIQETLEERERDEFTRLKVIKNKRDNK